MSGRSTAHRVECFFHCWPLLLVAAAVALCDVAAAQASRCGSADPDRVDRIPDAVIQQVGNVFLVINWLPPDHEPDRHYYYILRCDTCPNQQANVTGVEDHTFEGLQAATEYSFSIQAGYQNCTLSLPFDLVGRTVLSNLPGTVLISDVTQTSLRAQWAASPDVGVQYRVSCGGTVSNNSTVCYGLQSGSRIEVRVGAVKTGFPESAGIFGTALTKLYPIAASPATYSVTENAISVNWTASVTEGVRYQLSCSQSGSSDVIKVNAPGASATCGSLQSGQAYELSVTVLKDGGFESVSTNLMRQLTTPTTEAPATEAPATESSTSGTATTTNGRRGICPSEQWLQFSGFCYLLVKGTNGRTLSDALRDCQSRDRSAHLLWVTSQAEMDWVTDYSARNWRLKEDYRAQCTDCRFQGDAAWTGLFRDVSDGGKLKWLKDNSSVTISVPWLIGPSLPPNNFGFLFDAPRELLWRTYQPEARHFHLCKAAGRSQGPLRESLAASERGTGQKQRQQQQQQQFSLLPWLLLLLALLTGLACLTVWGIWRSRRRLASQPA